MNELNQTVCKCGKEFCADGIATGYAVLPDGERVCYGCADKMQIEAMRDRSKKIVAYLSDKGTITTWTGGKLGDVIRSRTINLTRMSFTHGRTIQSVKVRDVHGGYWVGQSNAGFAIRLRAVKG